MKEKQKATGERYSSPAVEQASQVLFCLAGTRSSHMSLTQICAQVGVSKSKAFCILEALQRFRLVQRNSDGKGYALGPGLVTLSRKVLDDLSPTRLAGPILEDLARKTGSTAILGLVADENVFIAAKCEGDGDIGVTTRIGYRMPATYGAHGIAIAAFLPEKDCSRLLKRKDLYFYGDPGGLNRERLQRDLAFCRRTGFIEDLGVARQGLNVVSAPVLGPSGTPVSYIELLVLFSAEIAHKFGPLVGEAGRSLSRQLGADVKRVFDNRQSSRNNESEVSDHAPKGNQA